MKRLLELIAAHTLTAVLGLAALGLIVYLLIVRARLEALQGQRDKAQAALVAAEAVRLQAVEGQLVSEQALRAGLTAQQKELLAALQKVDKRVRTAEQSKTAVTVSDKPTGHVGPSEWLEDHHRFGLNLTTFDFWRRQEFAVEGLVVAGVAGQRIEKVAFREFDPQTHEEIPLTGVELKTEFRFTKEEAASVGRWHPRVVALFGPQVGAGLGVQANPWRGLILTAGGAYSKSNGAAGAGGVGWRLRFPFLDSTLGLSILGAYSKGGFRADGAATAELTR